MFSTPGTYSPGSILALVGVATGQVRYVPGISSDCPTDGASRTDQRLPVRTARTSISPAARDTTSMAYPLAAPYVLTTPADSTVMTSPGTICAATRSASTVGVALAANATAQTMIRRTIPPSAVPQGAGADRRYPPNVCGKGQSANPC